MVQINPSNYICFVLLEKSSVFQPFMIWGRDEKCSLQSTEKTAVVDRHQRQLHYSFLLANIDHKFWSRSTRLNFSAGQHQPRIFGHESAALFLVNIDRLHFSSWSMLTDCIFTASCCRPHCTFLWSTLTTALTLFQLETLHAWCKALQTSFLINHLLLIML